MTKQPVRPSSDGIVTKQPVRPSDVIVTENLATGNLLYIANLLNHFALNLNHFATELRFLL